MTEYKHNAALRLPFLTGASSGSWGCLLDIGLADVCEPGRFRPDLPLSPAMARGILAGLRQMERRDMEAMANAANPLSILDNINHKSESAAIAAFLDNGKRDANFSKGRLYLQHSHEILLWAYHLEELALEVVELEAACEAAEQAMLRNFQEETREIPKKSFHPDPALLAPWKVVAANALLLCPASMPVFCEGYMAADLAEMTDFTPCKSYGEEFLSHEMPLWMALGWTKPAGSQMPPEIGDLFNKNRLWLINKDYDS